MKIGIEEWLVKVVKSMYRNAPSYVRVNGTFSDDFLVQVGSHQDSVLSLLLFIIVLEALSREIRPGCPEELLYTDRLALVSETIEGLKGKIGSMERSTEAKRIESKCYKDKKDD